MKSSLWTLSLLVLLICSCGRSNAAETVSLTDPRPVQTALAGLQTVYNVPISFEDMRYIHPSELAIQVTPGHPDPKGGSISFTYERPPANATLEIRKTMAANSIDEVLKSYAALRGTEMFTVIQTDMGFDVVATKSTDSSGHIGKLQQLLDTPVTISPGQRTAAQLIKELATSVSAATGRKFIWAGYEDMSMTAFWQSSTNITATNETARSVVMRLLEEHPGLLPVSNLSWTVECKAPDPGRDSFQGYPQEPEPECTLNIDTLTPKRNRLIQWIRATFPDQAKAQ